MPWLDGLWVSGQTAAAWPRPARADPFLPVDLQRSLGMAGASAALAVQEAAGILQAWQHGCQRLVLSWPRRENDTDVIGTTVLPTAIEDLPAVASVQRREQVWRDAVTLETLAEDPAPALDGALATGGARILELQARCPFKAFAELRLQASELGEPAAGVDRMTRGSALHRALQFFWQDLAGSAALQTLGEAGRESRLQAAVARALGELLPAGTGPRARQLELDWQQAAVRNLLAQDLQRPPFLLHALEQTVTGQCAGLALRLRVDRVDKVAGQAVIIDYKTGKAERSQWRSARMQSPQLPLYAQLYPEAVAGIAFASVGAHHAAYAGVGQDADLLPGLQPAAKFKLSAELGSGHAWGDITHQWQGWLGALAASYQAGHAEVDPVQPQSCRGCHLGALCRVNELEEEDTDSAESGDED